MRPWSLHANGVRVGHSAFLGIQGQSPPKPGKPHLRALPSLLLETGACLQAAESGEGLRGEAIGHHPPDSNTNCCLEVLPDTTEPLRNTCELATHFWILNVLADLTHSPESPSSPFWWLCHSPAQRSQKRRRNAWFLSSLTYDIQLTTGSVNFNSKIVCEFITFSIFLLLSYLLENSLTVFSANLHAAAQVYII